MDPQVLALVAETARATAEAVAAAMAAARTPTTTTLVDTKVLQTEAQELHR